MMTNEVFRACVKRLFGRYNRKAPEDADVLQDSWDAVKHIPDEAVPWIMGKLLDLDQLPRNWVREFKSLWDAWRTNHPEKCAYEGTKPRKDCVYCDQGELYSAAFKDGLWYAASAPCGHCSPFVPGSMTTSALNARGHTVLLPFEEDGAAWGQAPATFAFVATKNQEARSLKQGARNLPLQAVKSALTSANRDWDEARGHELAPA